MSEAIRVANVLLQNDKQQILLLRRSAKLLDAGKWGLAGGLIDANETPLSAACRELAEETGIQEGDIILGAMSRFMVLTNRENIEINMVRALLTASRPIVVDNEEHAGYTWKSVDDMFNLPGLLPGLPTMIAAMLDKPIQTTDSTITSDVHIYLL